MVTRILLLLSLLISSQAALALDNLTASVDKNPVLAGEYFTLTITAEGKVKGTIPDVSALSQNFVTSPVSTSSRTSIINGSMTSSTSWQVQLVARTPGEYTIPAFEVDGAKTQPITLNVVAQQDDEQSKDIFVKATLDSTNLYVQQAGLYTVKLYIGQDLLDGQLSAPEAEGATVTQLGKQQEEYEIVDGRRYMVITREYMLQPQRSGDITIQPPVFNGQVREGYRRMAVSAVAEAIELTVNPIPSEHADNWLPSEYVNFSAEWQPQDTNVTVGTPLTRTFTLTAVGVTKEQLPELNMEEVEGFRIYPDTSERKQITRDGKVISQLLVSFAYLPQRSGEFVLPEVSLPWFNTVTKRQEFATLPAKNITIKADPNQSKTVAPTSSSESAASALTDSATTAETTVQNHIPQWLWLITALGYLLWLATVVAWWLFHKARPTAKPLAQAEVNQPRNMGFADAVKKDDPQAFYQALLAYLHQQQQSLSDWLKTQPSEVQSQVHALQASLYGKGTGEINLKSLYQALQKAEKAHLQQQSTTPLDSLY
ncbi:BatD family protein [Pseudoalteromonas 'SMAR']|uniref:BatD family protein n=1 Tax=Pseudoalteromonas 'SMAR' TaxID=3416908 RepID=UPI003AF1E55F